MDKLKLSRLLSIVLLMVAAISYTIAMPILQNNRQRNKQQQKEDEKKKVIGVKAQPILVYEDSIPDSLLHPRWQIQRIQPITTADLSQNATDLRRPDNLKYEVVYNDTINRYIIGNKIGNTWITTPIVMTPEEYLKWSETEARLRFYRSKNDEIFQRKGKDKFDFSDMHFDLGPAEKIFGPGGVRVRTQGTAELKMGATIKDVDNPSLPVNNRHTTQIDFDEKINLSVNGKIGDKVNMNLNYNTDATFDFDAQNMKLKYDGKEDEIIKLVEAGNVSFPSNSSLISSASSLFGLRTDMQFGKLKLQMVGSQKKSNNKSVSSKGGVQTTPFEIDAANYEENRHFFLSHYFRGIYNQAMSRLPNISTGINITKIEIWVTNKTGTTSNTRNIVALTGLGDRPLSADSSSWSLPSNTANDEYATLSTMSGVRDIGQATSTLEGMNMVSGVDFEKLESARLLSSSEYSYNPYLGFVSLKSGLQTDQVLAVAYSFTYGGQTYQVGEFASEKTNAGDALLVKSLKNSTNSPSQRNWKLMMKNVYYLASSVEKSNFKLNIKYQSDTTGVYLSYIPESQVKDYTLIKAVGADRLDNNNKVRSNGAFDYIEGYTVSNGRVFLPRVEPFGDDMKAFLISKGVSADVAEKYNFSDLYDATKTIAMQNAEKDKYILTGSFRGTSANVISLGAVNVPQGSVIVTAGGVTLTEGSDYSIDYSAGEVTILNQSIIDAGTNVNVSFASNTDYGQIRKTMFGLNWEYDFSKSLQMSGTIQHLSEQALTSKVTMGSEPLNNTLWGININWNKESQWLTDMLNKIPFLHVTQPSKISFTGEFAQLIAGQVSGTQDNASYIDDFENSTNGIDLNSPVAWMLSSTPYDNGNHGWGYSDKTSLSSGYKRSQVAWYNIDNLFTRTSSSLTPSHIKSDLDQLSNPYCRAWYVNELFPNKEVSSYNGESTTLNLFNIAYYPQERGPYNFSTLLNQDGTLADDPKSHWGGFMRKLNTTDFESANIEYIEFWMMDPFIGHENDLSYGGNLYFNLGEISEDVLKDGQKFYESGMSVDGTGSYETTQWGKIPKNATITYSFATSSGSRAKQDVGFNGLTNEEERETFADYLNTVKGVVSDSVFQNVIYPDPANDHYHYFRGSDYDQQRTSILDRYKRINNPEGNSPDSDNDTESYSTSYKTTPDVEDINQDYTLNENDRYYEYKVPLDPTKMSVSSNQYIVDTHTVSSRLRNGDRDSVTWYKFRIPLSSGYTQVGSISDFSNIRFMRVYLSDFEKPIILRLANFYLMRGDWRSYEQPLSSSSSGIMNVSSVSIEENNTKEPVNYILPPGISRSTDPTQSQLTQEDERSLQLEANNFASGEAHAVYKNTNLDLREYKRIQMFTHANAFENNTTNLKDKEMSVFIRFGSDYRNNYYEYEIPLDLTEARQYSRYSLADCQAVWPENNMMNITLSLFTQLKKNRNIKKAQGTASYTVEYSEYDTDYPNNRVSIKGNPSLGEIKTIMIGVRNNSSTVKSGEVWVNELRVLDYTNDGGWAANGKLDVQLSDLGSVNARGTYISDGFGGLEDGVASRSTASDASYSFTTSLQLGKFFPDKAKVSIPFYYSVTKETSTPRYNPLDTDMKLEDALDALADEAAKDSLRDIAITKTTNTNFAISNARIGISTKRHPMPYDPANFTFSYAHSHSRTSGETTVYQTTDNWKGSVNYNWSPVYKAWEPFKKLKNKSKWLDIFRRFGLNWLPQNVAFNTDMTRIYDELQERDLDATENAQLPLQYSSDFRWNREFSLRWDLTKNLHMNFQSATDAEIQEPDRPVNKDLYPDDYEVWRDSVWQSIKRMGTPITYQQNFKLQYQVPLNLIPVFDWLNADGSYTSNYNWERGTQSDSVWSGNKITTNRTYTINSTMNMVKLYNHIPFLKKANERFEKNVSTASLRQKEEQKKKEREKRKAEEKKLKEEEVKVRQEAIAAGKDGDEAVKKLLADRKLKEQKKALPQNRRSFEKEITLLPDTVISLQHGKNSNRLMVTARTVDGKVFPLKFKKDGKNKIIIKNKVDSAQKVKVIVTPKTPLDDEKWYKFAQSAARVMMMVRNVNVSYRNQYSLTLPGFMPYVGNFLGQTKGSGVYSPGLDFAFGLVDDSYITKARDHGWLLSDTTMATPATSSSSEDLQIRMTLEPIKNLKIDLSATRTQTRSRSMEYVYSSTPTTESGTFSMTTISLKSAFEGIGDANNGFYSKSFEKFCNSLESFQKMVEAQYTGSQYPAGSTLAGKEFSATETPVDKYSADVMIPAFLKTYANGGGSLNIFPTLAKLLPNWSMRYSGLGKLPWFRDHFKSVNINHAYRSVYTVGSYNSYSNYQEYMNGWGFVINSSTGDPSPKSMYDISTVSISESFSPLLGVDMTFNNNLTAKVEYRSTRVLSLSMTSVQLNQASSKDWVVGMGYKINDFNLFGGSRKIKSRSKSGNNTTNSNSSKSTSGNTTKGQANRNLNLRLDVSYRNQASITRDIRTVTSTASSGNTAFKLSFSADYTLSRLLTMSFYYDRQTNNPLLTSSSYPTTTQDFGLSIKFSLTR